jgi:hypothetical protein
MPALDLMNQASRIFFYGNLGLAQFIKQLLVPGHKFPIYGNVGFPEGLFCRAKGIVV